VASDLFTVARTLAILLFDFRGYQSTHRFTLPPAASIPVLARYESLYRWLLKGTAADPRDRFTSAEEMAEQLHGVLREVVADIEGRPVPAPSTLFTGALRARPDSADWHVLPRPQAPREDPAAGYLAALTTTDSHALVSALRGAPERTRAVELRLAAALIEAEEFDEARVLLNRIRSLDPRDWRAAWYLGVLDLATHGDGAPAHFEAVLDDVPGELAPKLALAVSLELAGETDAAAGWYRVVFQTDPSITSASFGLARCRLVAGDRAGAVACLERVPDTSSGFIDAQVARVRYLASAELTPGFAELAAADASLRSLGIDDEQRERLTIEVLRAGLRLVTSDGAVPNAGAQLGGVSLEERDLRRGIEQTLRSLARRVPTRAQRIHLVDQANRTRPRTWV
jgi:serine/threonine-protein kinase PknG